MTREEQLEQLNGELAEELKRWESQNIDPMGFRLGSMELQIRVEILVLMEIVKEHLGIEHIDLDIIFKRKLIERMQEMRPQAEEAHREMRRNMIVNGVRLQRPELQ